MGVAASDPAVGFKSPSRHQLQQPPRRCWQGPGDRPSGRRSTSSTTAGRSGSPTPGGYRLRNSPRTRGLCWRDI